MRRLSSVPRTDISPNRLKGRTEGIKENGCGFGANTGFPIKLTCAKMSSVDDPGSFFVLLASFCNADIWGGETVKGGF